MKIPACLAHPRSITLSEILTSEPKKHKSKTQEELAEARIRLDALETRVSTIERRYPK